MAQSTDKRIVVGVDGSDSSLRALEWAAHQAEFTGSVLEVITTWQWPTSYGWMPPISDWDPYVDSEKMLEDVLSRLKETHPQTRVHPRVVEGHPAPVLIEASRGAELVVVGSRGHGEFAGMLLGSVGEHCVSHAHCPVLVLRDRD
jgi:nucleotide-binding universal stress UspA family protein